MFIFDDLSEVPYNQNSIITLGTFDGIHLGHRNIIDRLTEHAAANKGRSMLITFDPHPRNVVSDDFKLKILSTRREKIRILEKLGIDNLFIIRFTKEFASQTADEFFKHFIINGTGISDMIIGYDHHFGKGRSGDIKTLEELGKIYNFGITVVPEVKVNGQIVSSTKIRQALESGDLDTANKFLGRYYTLSGTVISGDKRGRELGFPTANIKVDDKDKVIPALGIYAVEFIVDHKAYKGLLSIGKRPTFYEEGEIVPEVYIYDFSDDIYGKFVTVNIIARLRGEEKFNSVEELISQMKRDKAAGLEIFNNYKFEFN
jgi:riboflavin kinase / FMN adenylyltransferase